MSGSDGHQRLCPFPPPAPDYVCSRVMASLCSLVYLVVGAVYLHDCPRQPYIPIYLAVMGILCLLVNVIYLLPSCSSCPYLSVALNGIIVLFSVCWFITGNVWIYSANPPSYNKTSFINGTDNNKTSFINGTDNKTSFINGTDNNTSFINATDYCNKTLYLFAFWTNNLFYILIGVYIFSSCCFFFLCG